MKIRKKINGLRAILFLLSVVFLAPLSASCNLQRIDTKNMGHGEGDYSYTNNDRVGSALSFMKKDLFNLFIADKKNINKLSQYNLTPNGYANFCTHKPIYSNRFSNKFNTFSRFIKNNKFRIVFGVTAGIFINHFANERLNSNVHCNHNTSVNNFLSSEESLHPSDFMHCLFSSHVYEASSRNTEVQFQTKTKKKYNQYLQGWLISEVFEHKESGYYGVLYKNAEKEQLVLAHRGTKFELADLFKKDSSLKTDIEGIVKGSIVPQQEQAFIALAKAIEVMRNAKKNDKIEFELSTTGHSLGAWLAEQCTYFYRSDFENQPYGKAIKAVTFDSPGSARTMESFEPNVRNKENQQKKELETLDIVTYLSAPNLINSCNEHVGTLYRIFPEIPESDWEKRFLFIAGFAKKLGLGKNHYIIHSIFSHSGHKLDYILETFDPVTGKPKKDEYKKVRSWPELEYQKSAEYQTTLEKVTSLILDSKICSYTIGSVIKVFNQFYKGDIDISEYRNSWLFQIEKEDLDPNNRNLEISNKFNLTYSGKHQEKEINLDEDLLCKERYPDTDYYLQQIKTFDLELLKNRLDNNDYYQQIKDLGECFTINGKKSTISVSTKGKEYKLTVEKIRNKLAVLLKKYRKDNPNKSLNKVFSDDGTKGTGNIRPEIITYTDGRSDPRLEVKSFIGRSEHIEKINDLFKLKQVAVIQGEPGVGKTTLAEAYAFGKISDNAEVIWINADSRSIASSYQERAQKSEIDTSGGIADIIAQMNNLISKETSKVYLVLDNVDKYEDIATYISGLPKNAYALITTRNTDVLKDNQLHLSEFNFEQSSEFFQKNIKRYTSVPDQEWEKFLEKHNLSKGATPYTLNKLAIYFDRLCIGSSLLESIKKFEKKKLNDKELDEFITHKLFEAVAPEEWNILKFLPRLDPDFIPCDLLSKLVSLDTKELGRSINRLEELGFVHQKDKDSVAGVSIHRLTQDEIEYSKEYAKLNNTGLRSKIIKTLDAEFPKVSDQKDYKWRKVNLIAPHVYMLFNEILNDQDLNVYLRDLLYDSPLAVRFYNYYKEIPGDKMYDEVFNNLLRSQKKHCYSAKCFNDLAYQYTRIKNYKESLYLRNKALKMQLREFCKGKVECEKKLYALDDIIDGLMDESNMAKFREVVLAIGINTPTFIKYLIDLATNYGNPKIDNRTRMGHLLNLALEIQEKKYGQNSIEVYNTLKENGIIYANHRRRELASKVFDKALFIQKEYIKDDSEISYIKGLIISYELKKTDDIKKDMQEEISKLEKQFGENSPQLIPFIIRLAEKYEGIDYKTYIKLQQRCLDIAYSNKLPYDFFIKIHINIACAYAAEGNYTSMIENTEQAMKLLKISSKSRVSFPIHLPLLNYKHEYTNIIDINCPEDIRARINVIKRVLHISNELNIFIYKEKEELREIIDQLNKKLDISNCAI
jgi:hypothetical protein